MKAKDIELMRVLAGIEHADYKKDYGYQIEAEADVEAEGDRKRVIGEALEDVARTRPVHDNVEDALKEHSPLKTRKKKFKGRLNSLESKVGTLEREVAHLRDQLGIRILSRTTPGDLVEDWDQTLHQGLNLTNDPLRSLPPPKRIRPAYTSPPPPTPPPTKPVSVSTRPDDIFDEEDIPLILMDDYVEETPVAINTPEEGNRFSGLDLDDGSNTAINKDEKHARFVDLEYA